MTIATILSKSQFVQKNQLHFLRAHSPMPPTHYYMFLSVVKKLMRQQIIGIVLSQLRNGRKIPIFPN